MAESGRGLGPGPAGGPVPPTPLKGTGPAGGDAAQG